VLRLLLLFTVVPLLELFLLLQLGGLMGPTATFGVVLVTGLLGAWLAKREGLGLLSSLAEELRGGLPPGVRLMEGAMVVVGGLLLVTPGVLTDLTGFTLIVPFTRRRLAPVLLRALAARFDIQIAASPPPAPPEGEARPYEPGRRRAEPARPPTPFSNPFDD
jgi:UPF0716 protein FxsA